MLSALLLPLLQAPAAAEPPVPDEIAVDLRGAPFARIVCTGAQSPYVYPLLGPGGVRMTRGFPMDPRPDEAEDHPHHRSMWLAHGDVNGVDFWHRGERAGTIETVAARADRRGSATAVELDLRWRADGADDALLEETRTLVFDGDEGERRVDVTSVFRARGRVVFGDTKEGTMALRLHPALRLKGAVARGSARNSAGQTGGAVWGRRARWVSYSGPVDGETVGVALLDHPENPRHPTWWHARDYGLVAANPFGAHDFEGAPAGTGDLVLAPGASLTLRWRVVLHAGTWPAERLDAAWEAFAAGTPLESPDSTDEE